MANYLEHLASPSMNTVTFTGVTLPAGGSLMRFRFRIPAGLTGDLNLIGEATSANRVYVSLSTGLFVYRANGTTYNSAAAGIIAGGTYEIEIEGFVSSTVYRLNGAVNTTKGFVITQSQPFTRLGSSATTRSRIDIYETQITSPTVNHHWDADGVTSGTVFPDVVGGNDGILTNFAGNPWKAEATINTIDNPIPADGAFAGTATGFTAGAATLTTPVIGGGTVSAAVTIAAGTDPKAFTATYPPPVSTQAYPFMGASHTHTLTQGATAATAASVVGAPAGYSIVTLNMPVTDNPAYITANLDVTPATGDLLVYQDADIAVDPSGFWTAPDPTTITVIHQIQSTGVIYVYGVTIDESGVVSPVDFLSAIGASSITASSIIAVGL